MSIGRAQELGLGYRYAIIQSKDQRLKTAPGAVPKHIGPGYYDLTRAMRFFTRESRNPTSALSPRSPPS